MNEYGINNFLRVADECITIKHDTVSSKTIPEEYAEILFAQGKEVQIMYSGGIDSEVVAEVCKRYSIPHRLHFIALMHRGKLFNEADYRNAIEFSTSIEIHPLEFDSFFDSGEYIDYAIQYRTRSPQLACHLKIAKDVGSNVVFGGDTMQLYFDNDSDACMFKTTEYGHFCYDNLVAEIGGIGNMANASYSLLIKYLQVQTELANFGLVSKIWTDFATDMQKHNYAWKCEMYRSAGFSSAPKQNKLTGFENVKRFYSDKYKEIGTCRKFDELYRKPLHRIVRIPSVTDIKLSVTDEIKKLLKEFGENYDKSRC